MTEFTVCWSHTHVRFKCFNPDELINWCHGKKSCILIVELGKCQISWLVYISLIFTVDINILTIQTRGKTKRYKVNISGETAKEISILTEDVCSFDQREGGIHAGFFKIIDYLKNAAVIIL